MKNFYYKDKYTTSGCQGSLVKLDVDFWRYQKNQYVFEGTTAKVKHHLLTEHSKVLTCIPPESPDHQLLMDDLIEAVELMRQHPEFGLPETGNVEYEIPKEWPVYAYKEESE